MAQEKTPPRDTCNGEVARAEFFLGPCPGFLGIGVSFDLQGSFTGILGGLIW